ncbi:N-acetylornithine carbamoyltransferase [Eisenibacter elegans]|jgi:N-succinyl-L-ornithine transcarbamylase|uniref:N-acetylornithine carbamoyltransferase n=1 Tax=Eisenibacter elegans TaxID=997 RepID=UPI00054EEEB3|nr:N-acetylornithine carbamoyltransferase [Eisenibacter elegans]
MPTNFCSLADVPNLADWVQLAQQFQQDPWQSADLGRRKTLGLFFFNPSIRTRLSTQRAAQQLGLELIVMNMGAEGWQLETKDGVVMDGDKAEHIRDAIGVMGQYCDLIGVRAFAGLQDRSLDYAEPVLEGFCQHAGVPILNLESATQHPLQAFADVLSIEAHKTKSRPKIVLTWAPHVKPLPQAVANSFLQWTAAMNYEVVVTHPQGYDLAPEMMQGVRYEADKHAALEGADFVYAKNWASYTHYGQILHADRQWTLSAKDMELTDQAYFMHCLPVRRNLVVEDAVIDGPRSLVQVQARNRIFSAQAALYQLLQD